MIEKITLHLDDANRFVPNEPIDCNDLNPKAMLLYAGAKCAGLTLLHILEKERIRPRRIEINMSADHRARRGRQRIPVVQHDLQPRSLVGARPGPRRPRREPRARKVLRHHPHARQDRPRDPRGGRGQHGACGGLTLRAHPARTPRHRPGTHVRDKRPRPEHGRNLRTAFGHGGRTVRPDRRGPRIVRCFPETDRRCGENGAPPRSAAPSGTPSGRPRILSDPTRG